MNQTDFAWLVGCSTPFIQGVEIGVRRLSEQRALLISAETDISPEWLLANDFSLPMVQARTGHPYTRRVCETVQASKHAPTARDEAKLDEELISFAGLLWSVVSAAKKKGQANVRLALLRLDRVRTTLVEEFGVDFEVCDGKDRARAAAVVAEKLAAHRHRKTEGSSKSGNHGRTVDASPKRGV